ncbi:MAG: hypothetical protein AAF670_20955, partial [Planctomycetota bacterium]
YSGHPLACAAAIATLDVYAEEGLFEGSLLFRLVNASSVKRHEPSQIALDASGTARSPVSWAKSGRVKTLSITARLRITSPESSFPTTVI